MYEIEKEYRRKFRKLSGDEVQELDTKWAEEIFPLLTEFYGNYRPVGRNAEKMKQRYWDYLYMYYILHPDHDWDERYDQPIFADAIKYAENA